MQRPSLWFRYRLQESAETFRKQGRLIRAYYYTALAEDQNIPDPAADRLAGLQRLHDGDQTGKGIHGFDGATRYKGNI